jgi:hypothetical protein
MLRRGGSVHEAVQALIECAREIDRFESLVERRPAEDPPVEGKQERRG